MTTKFDINQKVWFFDATGIRDGFVHSIAIKPDEIIFYKIYNAPIGHTAYEVGERSQRNVFVSKEEAIKSL